MATLYVVPDTNALLHYRRPDLLDWQTILDTSNVSILLLPAVLREIERHKDSGRDPLLRRRAQEISGWVRAMLRPGGEGSGSVELIGREPFPLPSGLDPDIADDRLIASAIEQRDAGRRIVVLSNDNLLQVKLLGTGLEGLWPRDEDRRQAEPDAQAAEIASLKQEVQTLRARLPALRLVWNDKEGPLFSSIGEPKLDGILSQEALQAKYSKTPLPGSLSPIDLHAYVRSARLTYSITHYQQYNTLLEDFYKAYSDWASEETRVRQFRSQTLKLIPLLKNSGTAPASDIRLHLRLPDGVRHLAHAGEAGTLMNPPNPPGDVGSQRPHRPAQRVHDFSPEKFIPEPWPGSTDTTWPQLAAGRDVITYLLPKAQQRQMLALHPFAVHVADPARAAFAIEGEAICDELPTPSSFKLVVKLKQSAE